MDNEKIKRSYRKGIEKIVNLYGHVSYYLHLKFKQDQMQSVNQHL